MHIWDIAPHWFRLITEEILDGLNELDLTVSLKLIDEEQPDAERVWKNMDLRSKRLFDYVPFTRLPHGTQTADALTCRSPYIIQAWSFVTDHLCVMPELGSEEFKLHKAEYDPPDCIFEHFWSHSCPRVSRWCHFHCY